MERKRVSKKREALTAAALKLFTEKGLRSVTVESIIEEAGVSKATYYNHFQDKEAIVEQVLQEVFAVSLNRIEQVVQEAKKTKLTKPAFLRVFDLSVYDDLFQSEFLTELHTLYPQLTTRYNHWVHEERMPLFRELMRLAKVDGILRMDIDPDVLIHYTFSVRSAMKQTIQQNQLGLESRELKDFAEQFFDLYLNGVLAERE
ncbi:TetR/AcrR family transcriptional regulator [Alkalicoccus luteus]|uniref:TetR/AcrR family transcriptional regulator n=1 Tax=Alkalicoccus luteus TaxID=1237094 RepID=A0A969PQA3_9BACI|nr:TetR/AcrR family transcriptional regulator [Alkalicoccus luteus]NJP38426.1 TetR/AcrR family transcriptional regulator [Alkalicoccus luteus]